MQESNADIVIIGAGLTGLTLAYLLRESGLRIKILEARNRIGGRIFTSYEEGKASIELGATWLGQQHVQLLALIKELNLEIFEQQLGDTAIYEAMSLSPFQLAKLPPNNNPSFRIKGGSNKLIASLNQHVNNEQIMTDQMESIIDHETCLIVHAKKNKIKAQYVISTLPPYLFKSTISVSPELPEDVNHILDRTHTWMGDSIKVGLRFKSAFWRENQLSGTIVSNVGPIPEMYDHSTFDDSSFALKGFFNGSYFSISREDRLAKVLTQLQNYYGDKVNDYTDYVEKVWANDEFTSKPYINHILPHQNNGNKVYQFPYLNGRLFIGGSETSLHFPGYMEGAVSSAQSLYHQLATKFNLEDEN